MHTPTRADAIRDQLAQELRGSALVVEDVRIQPAGKRRLVRVTVARDVEELLCSDPTHPADPVGPQQPVAPPSLDEVATASRTVAEILERSDLMGAAPYTLEVSSPGADQPLSTPAQFRRNVGRLLTLTYADGTSTSARLLAAATQGVRLSTAPQELVDYDRVERARVEIEFSRPDSGEDN
jgi:ribosome maturation factor RimP